VIRTDPEFGIDLCRFMAILDGEYGMTVKDMINTSYESNNQYCQKRFADLSLPKILKLCVLQIVLWSRIFFKFSKRLFSIRDNS